MTDPLARVVKMSDCAWLVQDLCSPPAGQFLAMTSDAYRAAGFCNRYCWAPFPAQSEVPPDRPRVLICSSEDGARGAFARKLVERVPGMEGQSYESGFTVERAGELADAMPVVSMSEAKAIVP